MASNPPPLTDEQLAAELRIWLDDLRAVVDLEVVRRHWLAELDSREAWDELRRDRGEVVPLDELRRRRILGPLPDDHPLVQRKPWPPELMKCPDDLVRPPTQFFRGIPAGRPCGPYCCRRPRGEDVA